MLTCCCIATSQTYSFSVVSVFCIFCEAVVLHLCHRYYWVPNCCCCSLLFYSLCCMLILVATVWSYNFILIPRMRTKVEHQYKASCRFYKARVECLNFHDFLIPNPMNKKQADVTCMHRILYQVQFSMVFHRSGKNTILESWKWS